MPLDFCLIIIIYLDYTCRARLLFSPFSAVYCLCRLICLTALRMRATHLVPRILATVRCLPPAVPARCRILSSHWV